MPVIGFIRDGTADASARYVAAFRKGLSEVGVVEGQTVTVEYHWLEGRHDRLPVMMADLVRRQVAVMTTVGWVPTLAAKAATTTILTIGLQIQILKASTIGEIDAAFATIERERPHALFVSGDAFFISRAVQFATLTARSRIPATYPVRDHVAVGGLMSYGTDFPEALRQVGVYTGKILKGAKPTDLPVTQSTKFELVINLQTARSLGIEVPPGVLSITDEVIE
jgi:hypothetical protein